MTRKELIFTVGLTTNFDACMPNVVGTILMSSSALCIHVGMLACFARLFVHHFVASARLSVRLRIVYHFVHRFIFRPSICLIFRPSVCLSVCVYVHMYLCIDKLSGHRKLN